MSKKYLLVLAGPTAIGKTDISIHLAKHFKTVILSADSRQIYKELNIGVAKPSAEQLLEIKHYFISHISIHQPYSAYDYQKEVHTLLPQLFQQYPIVIMTGGTGFYIHAVLNGFNEIPQISPKTKQIIQQLYTEKGLPFLQHEIKQKDPLYYQKADIQNPTRLIRALEVIYETQQPFSAFLNNQLIKKPNYFTPINIWFNMKRSHLYERIHQRIHNMLEQGLEQEAGNLYPYKHLSALNTVGYKEWWPYFEKKITKASIIEQIQRNTRHYAKKQITWFKHQWHAQEIKLLPNTSPSQILEQLLHYLEEKIL